MIVWYKYGISFIAKDHKKYRHEIAINIMLTITKVHLFMIATHFCCAFLTFSKNRSIVLAQRKTYWTSNQKKW